MAELEQIEKLETLEVIWNVCTLIRGSAYNSGSKSHSTSRPVTVTHAGRVGLARLSVFYSLNRKLYETVECSPSSHKHHEQEK